MNSKSKTPYLLAGGERQEGAGASTEHDAGTQGGRQVRMAIRLRGFTSSWRPGSR